MVNGKWLPDFIERLNQIFTQKFYQVRPCRSRVRLW